MFIDLLELNHLLQNSMYHLEFRYLHMCTFLYMMVWTLLLMSIHVLLNNIWTMVLVAYFFGLSMLMEDDSCYLKIIGLILKNIPYAWIMFALWKLLDKTAINFWTFMDYAYNVKYAFSMFFENMWLNICLNDVDCSTFLHKSWFMRYIHIFHLSFYS